MFSGIIEATGKVKKVEALDQAFRIFVQRPIDFDDLRIGDSVANDGVCLTVEKFDQDSIVFTLGLETLKILGRKKTTDWENRVLNLERSLRFGDRVHGHLVTGHVETMGKIVKSQYEGESLLLSVSIPENMHSYCWKKGSLTINGVSLTINELSGEQNKTVEVCLIPETVKRTNLGLLKVGEEVTLEPDYMARAVLHGIKSGAIEVPHV